MMSLVNTKYHNSTKFCRQLFKFWEFELKTTELSMSTFFFIVVWFEPTCVLKATKPFLMNCQHLITMTSPNLLELRSMHHSLTNMDMSTRQSAGNKWHLYVACQSQALYWLLDNACVCGGNHIHACSLDCNMENESHSDNTSGLSLSPQGLALWWWVMYTVPISTSLGAKSGIRKFEGFRFVDFMNLVPICEN